MALMVGELLAKINADASGYDQKADAVAKRHEKLTKQIGDSKPQIDADTGPIDKKTEQTEKKSRESAKAIDAAFSAAWQSVARDLQRIEREAWESGDGVSEAFTTSMDKAKAELQGLRTEAAKSGAGLSSELGDALRKVQTDIKELGPVSKKAGEDVGENLGDGVSDGLSDALAGIGGSGGVIGDLVSSFTSGKGALLGAGLAVGSFIVDGMQKAIEETRVGGMIAAQTGQATAEAGRLGKLAGDIYASNFGESVEHVGEAITALFQSEVIDTSASEAAIRGLTEDVLTLAQTTGESVGAITRSAQQLVLTGLAGSFTEAMDMIQHATEQGLNVSGELLDTIDEYSVQFKRMGLDGAEAFGLLEQATDAGARNIDVVADAIKEFAILAQDSASTASRGFKTLGMDARESMAAVAAGGEPAQEVLRQVLNRLQEMPPSVQRSTAAVDLFGTKAEDLGDALYAMDVDSVSESFGKFEGAVDQAGKTADETTPALDKLGRAIGNAASWVGGFFVDAADTMVQGLGEMSGLIDDTAGSADNAADSTEDWGSELWAANEASTTLIQTIDELIAQQSEYANTFVDSAEAQIDYNQALAEATELAKDFSGGLNDAKTGFDLTSEAGQTAQGVINDVVKSGWDMVEALSADGASAEQLNAVIAESNKRLYELLVSMGLDADAARVMADRLFGIPDVDPTVTLVDNASPKIADITKKLNALDGKWVNTYVNTIFRQTGTAPPNSPAGGGGLLGDSAGGGATGAIVEFYAQGGLRPLAPAGSIIGSYSRTGVMRVIGDNPRFDEAYIPLDRSSSRSQAILDEALKRMRPEWFGRQQSGTVVAAPSGPSHVDRSITVYAAPSVPTTQQLRDLQHEQEVLYGRP